MHTYTRTHANSCSYSEVLYEMNAEVGKPIYYPTIRRVIADDEQFCFMCGTRDINGALQNAGNAAGIRNGNVVYAPIGGDGVNSRNVSGTYRR